MPADAAGDLMRRRETKRSVPARDRAEISQILDLFGEDSQLNLYRGELEVRPPGAPTSWVDTATIGGSCTDLYSSYFAGFCGRTAPIRRRQPDRDVRSARAKPRRARSNKLVELGRRQGDRQRLLHEPWAERSQ